MFRMNEKERRWWRKHRKTGFTYVVLVHGVMLWGLPMLLGMGFVNDLHHGSLLSSAVATHCMIWLVGGLMFGVFIWFETGRRYRRDLQQRWARR